MTHIIFDLVSNTGRLAIAKNGQLLASRVWENERSHAEFLVQHIDDCLGEAGKTYADVQRVGLVNGPGSFTGVRIAVSCAKALHLALGVSVATINTLAQWGLAGALTVPSPVIEEDARKADEGELKILIAQDVRRAELAVQCFNACGNAISAIFHGTLANIAAQLPHGTYTLAGSGAQALLNAQLPHIILQPLQVSDEALSWALAQLTARAQPSHTIEPFYIRGADAQLPKNMLEFAVNP